MISERSSMRAGSMTGEPSSLTRTGCSTETPNSSAMIDTATSIRISHTKIMTGSGSLLPVFSIQPRIPFWRS